MTVGPRAFKSILLLGIFASANLGINLLKSGYSKEGSDLPDTLDAILFLMKNITFLEDMGNSLEKTFTDGLERIPKDSQIGLVNRKFYLIIIKQTATGGKACQKKLQEVVQSSSNTHSFFYYS